MLCAEIPPPRHLSFFTAAMSFLLAIITIPGNALVCVAIVRDPFRELKTPFSYFLLSLAVTDLLVGTLMDTISAVYHLSEGLQLALVGIKTVHVAYFILCTASILTLAALTVDRYYAVMAPLRYKSRLTPRKVRMFMIAIWVSSLALSMLYFALSFILYSLIFAVTSVAFTVAVLLFVYARIYQRLNQRLAHWSPRLASNSSRKDRKERRKQLKLVMSESKATKAFVFVLLAFLVSFAPACVIIFVLNFCRDCSCDLINWLRDLQVLLVLLNSGVNPYMYALRLPQFKKVIGKFTPKICKKKSIRGL